MIQLHITKTGKSFSPNDDYHIFDIQTKNFADMKNAKEFLKEEYGKSKRQLMYQDDKTGKARIVGYIYGFRNADYSHYPVDKWLEQDWVEFREVKQISPITKKEAL